MSSAVVRWYKYMEEDNICSLKTCSPSISPDSGGIFVLPEHSHSMSLLWGAGDFWCRCSPPGARGSEASELTTANTSHEERRRAGGTLLISLSEGTRSFSVCASWEMYVTHNSLSPMSPMSVLGKRRRGKKNSTEESLMRKSRLPLFPNSYTKPFSLLIVPECTNNVLRG